MPLSLGLEWPRDGLSGGHAPTYWPECSIQLLDNAPHGGI